MGRKGERGALVCVCWLVRPCAECAGNKGMPQIQASNKCCFSHREEGGSEGLVGLPCVLGHCLACVDGAGAGAAHKEKYRPQDKRKKTSR